MLRDEVLKRSHGCCELMHDGCPGPASELHHRRMRSAGGEDIVENLLHLCPVGHKVIVHGNPKWSYRHGLLLRRGSRDHPDPILGCPLDCPIDHYA